MGIFLLKITSLSRILLMKQFFLKMVLLLSLFNLINSAHAQGTSSASLMDPKTKAFLVICGYGTVGGALLGLASMAFGQTSRAVAQGASLGLYSGILFGAYVVMSHDDQIMAPQPNEPQSPYEDNQFVPYQGDNLETNYRPAMPQQVAWAWNF